ncbi:MAG: hypothetical protein CVU53_00615 [Deltaproteobacteria bacterium HGW-Deltaproteobacteria-11]|nr:MAG: hypothetical protein CVU53_00615 [Deltaproteobacteria bacterium HGW-Deltaproteobacteria-11]
MKAYATKLMDLTESNAEKIARQWAKDVKTNEKTKSYHGATEERIIQQAIGFYHQFREMFVHDTPYKLAENFFEHYAQERCREGIPLHEAVYALILMRRHIWLYAEFQAIFIAAVEHRQAVESLSRTILMFDYAMYVITRKYRELMKLEWFEPPNT